MAKDLTDSEFNRMIAKLDKVGDGVFKVSPRITAVIIVAVADSGQVLQSSNMPKKLVSSIYRQLADVLDSKSSSARTTNLRHN